MHSRRIRSLLAAPHAALLAGVALLVVGSAPAIAKPIVPGAAPLWLAETALDAPAACPSPDDLGGKTRLDYVRRAKDTDGRGERAVAVTIIDAFHPRPVAALCDPAALSARRLPGAITGDSALDIVDEVFWGERGLVGTASAGADGLRPGDQLNLPAAGPGSVVDLTLAAGDGTSSVRIEEQGSPAVAVRIAGTIAAPSIVVTRADGSQHVVAAPVPSRVRFSLTPSRTANVIKARFRTPANTIVVFAADDGGGDARITGASGRITLTAKAPRRSTTFFAVAYDPGARRAWSLSCRTAGGQQPRCGKPRTGLAGFLALILDEEPAQQATASIRRARPSAVARARRTARDAPRAAATVTRVTTDRAGLLSIGLAAGDVNGDGRPDAWARPWSASRARLVVSAPGGGWKQVTLVGNAESVDAPVVGDLDGDGRGELLARGGVIVTDAFASGAIPATIDLGRRRLLSVRDLIPGEAGADLLPLSGVPPQPSASVADTTGDGRPELVFDAAGPLSTLASEAVPPGRQARRASVGPVSHFDPTLLDGILGSGSDASDSADDDAERYLSHKVVGGRLFTVAPQNRATVSTISQVITLDERRADGSVVASRTFRAAGWPRLLDVDPATGDALVQLAATRCPRTKAPSDLGRPGRVCPNHLLRIDAGGTVIANVTFGQPETEELQAVFADDGADADAAPETLLVRGNGLNPGQLRILSSTATGVAPLDGLPVVDLGAARVDDLVRTLEVVVMPNGRRWAAVQTLPVTSEDADRPSELLIVEPK